MFKALIAKAQKENKKIEKVFNAGAKYVCVKDVLNFDRKIALIKKGEVVSGIQHDELKGFLKVRYNGKRGLLSGIHCVHTALPKTYFKLAK